MRGLRAMAGYGGKGDSLLQKYQALLHKYEQLVEKLQTQTFERTAVFRLANWALQTSFSGLALISNQRFLVCNPVWHELNPAGRRLWVERGAPDREAKPRTLRAIALDLVRAFAPSEQSFEGLRLERIDRRQTIELRLDKVPREPGQVVVMARDVTQQVRAEEELSQVREVLGHHERLVALGQLVSGVAHDLASSLAAMRLRVQMLQADPELIPRHGKDLRALDQIVSDAATRVRRMHDAVRQRPQSPLGAVELTRVIADAIELVRTEVGGLRRGKPRYSIRADVPDLPVIQADAAELRYVLVNLFLNARDAMPEGGRIDVRARVRGERVEVTVEDEGTGIPPELLEKIFKPFFTTKGAQGSGLGLSMAREVMKRLGGAITAANRPKRGAVFTLTFPVPTKPARETSGRRPAARKGRRRRRRRR